MYVYVCLSSMCYCAKTVSYFLAILLFIDPNLIFVYFCDIYVFSIPSAFWKPESRRSFCFRRFKLGHGVPQVLGVEVSDAPCRGWVDRQGVELRVAFNLEHLDV